MRELKIGIVGQENNKGLGNMTWEFCNHIKPYKICIMKGRNYNDFNRFPEAIKVQKLSDDTLKSFLKDLDIVIILETLYCSNIIEIAKEMKVKTVLIPMYEFFDDRWEKPDLYFCTSKIDYDIVNGNKIYIPWAINDEVLKRRKITQAKKFLFNTGMGGIKNRNSSDEFFEAIKNIKGDIKFIINAQRKNNIMNYFDLWKEGDIFIFPHKFGGLSLPIQEAMITGMPVITTDFYPFNEFIPKELLMKPDFITKEKITREINFYHLKPETIIKKIEEVASWSNKKIEELSDEVYDYASKITWDKLLNKYLKIFNEL